MGEKLNGIDVVITIRGHVGVPASVLRSITTRIEREIYFSELRDLKAVLDAFPDIKGRFGERLQAELYKNRSRAAVITGASNGSLVITVTVLGAAYWLLDKTIGKSVQEAYIRTDFHEAIKRLLLFGEKKKVEELQEAIEERVFPPPTSARAGEKVHVRHVHGPRPEGCGNSRSLWSSSYST